MNRALLLLPLLSACAPSSPAVEACERYILGKIATPATYERVGSFSYERDGKLHLSVDYDAQNLAGATVREKQFCQFPIVDGRPQTTSYIDHDAEMMSDTSVDDMGLDTNAEVAADRAVNQAQAELEQNAQ